jgi:uncharacterized small protein (DUF1192 family)
MSSGPRSNPDDLSQQFQACSSLLAAVEKRFSEHHATHGPQEFDLVRHLELIRSAAQDVDSWDDACQLFLALRAAERGYRDLVRTFAYGGRISRQRLQRLLAEGESDRHEFAQIQQSLAFTDGREFPRTLEVVPQESHGKSIGSDTHKQYLSVEEIATRVAILAKRIEQSQQKLQTLSVFVPSPHELAAQKPNSSQHFTRQVHGERVRERGRTTLGSPPLPDPLPHKHRGNALPIEEF